MATIRLPHKFEPRTYQFNLFKAIDSGFKRLIQIWHRRSGKEKSALNITAKKMLERVGAYYYIFPTYAQGNRVLWEGRDKDGFKFMDHIPQELRVRTDQTKMFIELVNGSTFQIIGSDNIDSIVGANPVGVVFSEFSLQDPQAWDYIRPILAENGGWAIFNYTPRGKNHAFDLLEYAKTDPKWFWEVLTADDTHAIPQDVLEQERKEIIAKNGDDAIYLQEYFCSFEASVQGSYYGRQLAEAEEQGRIGLVPYDPTVPVDTWWDLGIGDSMTIWFTQSISREIHVIDYEEGEGEGIPYYKAILQQKGYVYGVHHWPHDGKARELSTGVSRQETAEKIGINPIQIVESIGVDEGIQATRLLFSRCWIDKEKCKKGLNALKSYHKEYDERRKVYKDHPEHDWASHAADGFRTLGVGHAQYKDVTTQVKRKKENTKMTKWG